MQYTSTHTKIAVQQMTLSRDVMNKINRSQCFKMTSHDKSVGRLASEVERHFSGSCIGWRLITF